MTFDLSPVEPEQARRVELLLHQLECLPTPGPIAARLLELASAEGSRDDEIATLVRADPALSSRLLRMCRCESRARPTEQIATVEEAVRHLGSRAVRGAVLSIQVMQSDELDESTSGRVFCRRAFWQHSLAVAMMCEALAVTEPLHGHVDPKQAFVAGLLHDLGMLGLHVLLPERFDQVCRFAETSGISLDRSSRRIIGMTAHAAGRRLAEHWRLPHMVGDVLWLHGQPSASLPDLPHRHVIELVTLADAIARARYRTPAGHLPRGEDLAELARPLGLLPEHLEEVASRVPEEVNAIASRLDVGTPIGRDTMLSALSDANETLGRMYADAQRVARRAGDQGLTLQAVIRFHDAAAPGGSFVSVFGKVVRSAHHIFGGGFFAMLYQGRVDEPWNFMQFAGDGRLLRSEVIQPPSGSTAVADLADHTQVSMQALAMLPWLSDYVGDARDVREVRLLPLRCGWGVNAILVHDCPVDGVRDRVQLEALSRTWAAAIAAASHHAGAKSLGEQLAEANRALLETRDELTRREKLASLGEIAAGAAHEMNNPLTVISGRAQLLSSRLDEPDLSEMARQIVDQSHRLSGMISTLRSFAEPVAPNFQPVHLPDLLDEQVGRLYREQGEAVQVKVVADQELPVISADADQLGAAIRELLCNAMESEGSSEVEVRVQIDPLDDRLQLQIMDDGMGLTKHALAHAFDPFFSAKSAGRQPGLGLAHARRVIEAHGGQITLENLPTRGAVATVWLADWRVPGASDRRVA